MSDRGGQRAQGREPRHMCELGSCLVEGFLRESAPRHVLNGANLLHSALIGSNSVGDQLQMLDGMARHHEPMLVFEVTFPSLCPFHHFVQHRKVLGVYSTADERERDSCAGHELEHPIHLVGPGDVAGSEVPQEIANLGETLAFHKERFTAPEPFLRSLAVFDVGVDPVPVDDGACLVAQRIRYGEETTDNRRRADVAALRPLPALQKP